MKTTGITLCLLVYLAAAVGHAQTRTIWVPPKHDGNGDLLPLQSYGETINRGMKFILEDQVTWAKGNKITDADGKTRPPYFFYCLAHDGQLGGVGHPLNRDTAYPAFHHAIFVQTFLAYYIYSGNPEALKRAEELAAWNISHSTPLDWKYGGLPYSTVQNGKLGGSADADAIMTDKPAIMGLAYLRLFRTTGKREYRRAAEQIANTLAKTQRLEGNWPFRVNPQTGAVREEYTSSAIYAVELFEELEQLGAMNLYAQSRAKALMWLRNGPMETMKWTGFYEDVGKDVGRKNRTNWDCIDTARYLLRHRGDNGDNLLSALKLYGWVKKTFVDQKHTYGPAEAVREQLVCNVRMGVHSGHWAMLGAELYEATGEEQYRRNALNTASYITYLLQPDNRIPVGRDWKEKELWYSCHFGAVLFLMELLGHFPECAPDGESHLLHASGAVQAIHYEPSKIVYSVDAPSRDVLRLAFIPSEIVVNGKLLPAGDGTRTGWKLDPRTRVLRLVHEAGRVVIHVQR